MILHAVEDLGEGPRGTHPSPFILGKKKEKLQKEEKPAGQAKQNCLPPQLAQSHKRDRLGWSWWVGEGAEVISSQLHSATGLT